MRKALLVLFLSMSLATFSNAGELGFNGVGVGGGVLLPSEDGLETGFGFGVKVNMGEITDGLTLMPLVQYHLPGSEFDAIDFSALVIGADAQYGVNENVYAGGGLAYYNKSVEIDFGPPIGTRDDSEGDIGFSILAGYKLMLGSMKAAIEARYNIVTDYNHIMIGLDVFFGGN